MRTAAPSQSLDPQSQAIHAISNILASALSKKHYRQQLADLTKVICFYHNESNF